LAMSAGDMAGLTNHLPISLMADRKDLDTPFRLFSSVQLQTRQIDFQYDPLNRLIVANDSLGESHDYTYDPTGNVVEYRQTTGGNLTTTIYTYDSANQLLTAQASHDLITWHYQYDARGSLTDVTPGGLSPTE
jgi:YD repeat-containing protein